MDVLAVQRSHRLSIPWATVSLPGTAGRGLRGPFWRGGPLRQTYWHWGPLRQNALGAIFPSRPLGWMGDL
jgi:hypothetical protein